MDEFVNTLVQQLRKCMGKDVSVEHREVLKVNDIATQAICFLKGELMTGTCVADEYYQMFQNGKSMDEIVEAILDEHKEDGNLIGGKAATIMADIYRYEKVSGRVVVKLLSMSRNQKYLRNKVYSNYLDFAVCYAVYMGEVGDKALSSIAITNEIFQKWDMPVDELYEKAVENTRRLWPEKVEPVSKALNRLTTGTEFSKCMNPPEAPDMYLLTNEVGMDGAAAILYEGALKDCADSLEADRLYLLPSSRHEFIIIPDDGDMDIDQLAKIVHDVNDEVLTKEEFLGDRVYLYERGTDRVTFA